MAGPGDAARNFDQARASDYETQSRIALAGYDICHELAACVLAAALRGVSSPHVLVAGAGGGAKEIVTAGTLEPTWRFTAVDPSKPMMDLSLARLRDSGLLNRTTVVVGAVDDLPLDEPYDAATLIGVLHHLTGDEAKAAILEALSSRLLPGAPLVLACNHSPYESQPLLLVASSERWRMLGATAHIRRAKLRKIVRAADPPHSEEHVAALLAQAGFESPSRFFCSLFWGAWITRRRTGR
jgi:tRNA (cmo5U34)-methyltransferase